MRVEPDRDAEWNERAIDGEAASGAERHPLGTERALARDLAEEDIGRVLAPQRRALLRMRLHPSADSLHGQLLARNFAALEQQPADRHVGMAIAAVIADPNRAALLQPYLPRSLDLQKEGVDRVVNPGELKPLPGQRAILDLGPAETLSVRRPAVDRDLERAASLSRAVQRDLVIAGEEPLARAVVAGEQRHEIGLEEMPRRHVVASG